MRRVSLACFVVMSIFAARSRGDDDALKYALALEATIQKVAEKVEPSIACILVSRSGEYAKLGAAYNPGQGSEPGKLGGFIRPQEPGRFNRRGINFEQDKIARLDLSVPDSVPDSYGSGVVIDSKGLILTNRHVIHDATKIYVRLPKLGGSYANVHAADERSDLAVLKLIDPPAGLKALPMGDADTLKKGQFLLSISNPFAAGFKDGSPSVSWGMLSNIRRRLPGEPNEGEQRRPKLRYYSTLLQTDMRMPLGCSGGALLDLHGNWVGLTTSISGVAGGESAGGYAIPIDKQMKRIIGKLHDGLEVEYGFLGIQQTPRGWEPTRGGPADKAGMTSGETIVSIEGHPIEEVDDLLLNIAAALAGTEVRMVVEGFGQRRELRPRLVKTRWRGNGPIIAANQPKPVYGLRVDYSSVDYAPAVRGGDPGIPGGVAIRDVVGGSPAANAGLRPEHDIIEAINGHYVETPEEFYEIARRAKGPIELMLDKGRKVKLP